MKKIYNIFSAVLLTLSLTAQVPQKMSYQAIIRNNMDSLVRNQPIGMRISILKGKVDGTVIYQRIISPNPITNINGLVTVEIGTGSSVKGIFSEIDWSNGPYFIKTEIDPTGRTDYSLINTSQLLSVPYAFHAKTAEALMVSGDAATKAYIDAVLARIEAIEKHLDIETDVFIDSRDGNLYKWVEIGEQIWMAENLRYLPDTSKYSLSNSEPNYYINFDYNTSDPRETAEYFTYGVLYNWPAAMNGDLPVDSINNLVQGVCPSGWHLPSQAEWEQLINYLGGDSIAGGKMKEADTKNWMSPNTGATNESGFTALPGGDLNTNWGLTGVGSHTIWWSSSWNSSSPTDYFPGLEYDSEMVHWGKYKGTNNSQDYKSYGLSVRCLKD